jgi:two-component system, cell cycle sensor histidine kinase and response regulator CckA
MKKRPHLSKDRTVLRRQAEERLEQGKPALDLTSVEIDPKRLVHELQVHQVELEMQNEDLLRTQEELEKEKERYSDLYTFAPIAYMTLNELGYILAANLTAADFLGEDRNRLIKLPFTKFIFPEDRDIYYHNHKKLLETREKQIYELRMQRTNRDPLWAKVESTVFHDGTGGLLECRIVMDDITDRKHLEDERERLILELKDALAKVKLLSGMLPICASCKKIRDDHGYWRQIESYIREHSEAEFSHSICPACMKKLYPDHCEKNT